MKRQNLVLQKDGSVCYYSCEGCGGELKIAATGDDTIHVPKSGNVLLVCQLCGHETEFPDEDKRRNPDCLYTVNVNIIWNNETDGGETVSDVELVSFRSETAARDFLGDVMDRMALNQFQTRVRELAAGMGCQIVGDLGADQIQIHPPAGMRFRGLNKMAGDRNYLHAHCRDGGVPEPAWETLYGELCKGLEVANG